MSTQNDISLQFTPQAIAHLKKQLAKQAAGSLVRFYIKTAGCSGLQYKFDFVPQAMTDDISYAIGENLTILIDSKALPFINNLQVDYVKEGLNQHFKFTNPNEKGSCGCGESFFV